ncbi:hypothetical protein BO86DRAFT_395456 [Aspergillus japonicus CBS 114.51]|uniref:Geranylgeranyl pyrophosphate synthetase n=1 Tax=Aspergillus japonicus CBS 114.51 TaxID=1448312 RepID=A0A8T8XDB1_ASPJA|nr:hypothetical protein BO86DRAFT_395456 [Aspergillus japonicus CBS 114.51]RAH86010.1 hypothetical protein BO86DRAFT_395456 [Aspergillus japonicus CBS 114.51]
MSSTSYNWIKASSPTIAVPGSPALWSPPDTPTKVDKDSGLVYIAQNAARHPDSPLEPLFRARYLENPSFDIHSVDLVTDRNNIRKLLTFVNPTTSRNGLEPFTILVELATNTQAVIFCRSETKTFDNIGRSEFKGFGHEFEKAFTTEQVTGSTGHHRIISYLFGGLKLLVRYETDGYVDFLASEGLMGAGDVDVDEVSRSFESLYYEKAGLCPFSQRLKSKLATIRMPIDVHEVIPQLWVSQTPNLVRAYHKEGLFEKPPVEDMEAEIKNWEAAHQNDLEKLVSLFARIISVVKHYGGRAVLKYDSDSDKLEMWEGSAKDMLPADLYDRFNEESFSSEFELPSCSDCDSKSTPHP